MEVPWKFRSKIKDNILTAPPVPPLFENDIVADFIMMLDKTPNRVFLVRKYAKLKYSVNSGILTSVTILTGVF